MHSPVEVKKIIDAIQPEELKILWKGLAQKLSFIFGEEPDLQAVLFLIGVQELGKGRQPFSKEEKTGLMHIATCRLLSTFDIYRFEKHDEDGWPHWVNIHKLPALTLAQQDMLLKKAAVIYFEETGVFA